MNNRIHNSLNIQYSEFTANELQNLTAEQAVSMAAFITSISRRLAEAEFLLAAHENNWPIPEIANYYKR